MAHCGHCRQEVSSGSGHSTGKKARRNSARLRRAACCAALLDRAQGGLTPFLADPVHVGLAHFQHDVYIPEHFLEPDDGQCSSMLGPACFNLQNGMLDIQLRGAEQGHAPSMSQSSSSEVLRHSRRSQQCRPVEDALGGIYSIFGSLSGDPGFFVQDEVGKYFARAATDVDSARLPEVLRVSSARCLRVSFDNLPPHLLYLPTHMNITQHLSLELVGSFALLSDGFVPGSISRDESNLVRGEKFLRAVAPVVQAEVQQALVYLRFTEPVTVEQIWLARAESSRLNCPVVLRGRNGPEEHWSAYLREADFQRGWVTPLSISTAPINEIVVLCGQGLRIASLYVSQLSARQDGQGASADVHRSQYGWLLTPRDRMQSLNDMALSRLILPSAAAVFSIAELHHFGCMRLRAGVIADTDETLDETWFLPGTSGARQVEHFVDARSINGMLSLLEDLQTGTVPFPRDVSLELLEADVHLYRETFGGVTLDEAVNSRNADELYERLFMASRTDALDLLFLRHLWQNDTRVQVHADEMSAEMPLDDEGQPSRTVGMEHQSPTNGEGSFSAEEAADLQSEILDDTNAASRTAASGQTIEEQPPAASHTAGSGEGSFSAEDLATLQSELPDDIGTAGNGEGSFSAEDPATLQSELPDDLSAASRTASSGGHSIEERRRAIIEDLHTYTSLYARWKQPIERKEAVLNASGAADVAFMLNTNASILGIDYYNSASGRSLREQLLVPDADYLLAELLGIEAQLLVDQQGEMLPEALARSEHQKRTYLEEFKKILEEMQLNTSDLSDDADTGPLSESGVMGRAEPVTVMWNTPPLYLVATVSCSVVSLVLLAMFAPPVHWQTLVRRHAGDRAFAAMQQAPEWLQQQVRALQLVRQRGEQEREELDQ